MGSCRAARIHIEGSTLIVLERLHKILARAGVAALRPAEDMILQGRVSVNGRVVRELGARADADVDVIAVDGTPIDVPQPSDPHHYVMLHKPVGVISTAHDTHGRPTVVDLVPSGSRLFPVGRLDADSEGLLLLTDDGDLAYRLTHPRFEVDKEYRVLVDHTPQLPDLRRWRSGVELDGAMTAPAWVEVLDHGDDGTWLRVVMREGRKRQIREVARILGMNVHRLIRVREGSLALADLAPGSWRTLTPAEVESLRTHTQHVPSREADEQRERTMSEEGKRRRLRVIRRPARAEGASDQAVQQYTSNPDAQEDMYQAGSIAEIELDHNEDPANIPTYQAQAQQPRRSRFDGGEQAERGNRMEAGARFEDNQRDRHDTGNARSRGRDDRAQRPYGGRSDRADDRRGNAPYGNDRGRGGQGGDRPAYGNSRNRAPYGGGGRERDRAPYGGGRDGGRAPYDGARDRGGSRSGDGRDRGGPRQDRSSYGGRDRSGPPYGGGRDRNSSSYGGGSRDRDRSGPMYGGGGSRERGGPSYGGGRERGGSPSGGFRDRAPQGGGRDRGGPRQDRSSYGSNRGGATFRDDRRPDGYRDSRPTYRDNRGDRPARPSFDRDRRGPDGNARGGGSRGGASGGFRQGPSNERGFGRAPQDRGFGRAPSGDREGRGGFGRGPRDGNSYDRRPQRDDNRGFGQRPADDGWRRDGGGNQRGGFAPNSRAPRAGARTDRRSFGGTPGQGRAGGDTRRRNDNARFERPRDDEE
jgi:23S rRNA pseudouridine2605 synthase